MTKFFDVSNTQIIFRANGDERFNQEYVGYIFSSFFIHGYSGVALISNLDKVCTILRCGLL